MTLSGDFAHFGHLGMMPPMGLVPVWWMTLCGVLLLTCLALWVLTSRRGRTPSVEHLPDLAPARPAPVTSWVPQIEAMGLVSGWPHALEAPDSPPAGSPEDRPDLWAMLP